MTPENAPESPTAASQPESGAVSDRDAQDAREARYGGAWNNADARWCEGETRTADADLGHDEYCARAVIAVADSELAPLVARVAELEAEVAKRTFTYEMEQKGAGIYAARAERAEAARDNARRANRANALTAARLDRAVRAVEALADDLTAEADGAFGMPELLPTRATLMDAVTRIRAALAAAGPAVPDGDVHNDCEHREIRRLIPDAIWACVECSMDFTPPAVSDGEGATSEALDVCLPSTGYSCGHCHRCRPAPDAVPSGEATDGTTPTKEA